MIEAILLTVLLHDPLDAALDYHANVGQVVAASEQQAREEAAAAEAAQQEREQAATSSSRSSSTQGVLELLPDPWDDLAACESGGDPTIVSADGLYHGLFQFLTSTWQAVGGTGTASQATWQEQLKRARILQQQSGWGPWPQCAAGW